MLPTDKTVQAAANPQVGKTPKDERISLIFAPVRNPIRSSTTSTRSSRRSRPNAETAKALKAFLDWALDPERRQRPQVHR